MVLLRDDPHSNKQTYFDIGLQYYLAGRVAFIDQLFPVAGNLFHHATEMFLKAALMPGVSPEDLYANYRHRIVDLWNEYIKIDPKEDKYSSFIAELSKWEELRYPKRRDDDIVMHFRMDKNKSGLGFQDLPGRKSSKYELSLEEMDEFFQFVVNIPIVSKDYVKMSLKFGSGNRVEDFKEFNKHIGDLLS